MKDTKKKKNVKNVFVITAMILLTASIVLGTDVQISSDNTTWKNITGSFYNGNIDETEKRATTHLLNESTSYCIRGKNGTTNWQYICFNTKASGEVGMSSISITLFVLLITGVFFYLGLGKKVLLKNSDVSNLLLKRACILMGLFLLSLDTTIILTMADNMGLGVTQEMFRFLWLINWSAYLMMVYIFWTGLIQGLRLWKFKKHEKRMGFPPGGTDEGSDWKIGEW